MDGTGDTGVLESERAATSCRILVELAKRQPAVSQQEVVDAGWVAALGADHDLVAVDAPEGVAAARPGSSLRFDTTTAVRNATPNGFDVLLLAASPGLSTHTDALREHNVSYEILDPVDEW